MLLEIGCEELPASFVNATTAAFPDLARARLRELRLTHGSIKALGTPRRLTLIIEALADAQPDLDEQVLGPPARVAFDAAGKPTKAAAELCRQDRKKPRRAFANPDRQGRIPGWSPAGRRNRSARAPARRSRASCAAITFRKSMRWCDGDTAFGRPMRWLVALLGEEPLDVRSQASRAARVSRGHRFLHRTSSRSRAPRRYAATLRRAARRRRRGRARARDARAASGGGARRRRGADRRRRSWSTRTSRWSRSRT